MLRVVLRHHQGLHDHQHFHPSPWIPIRRVAVLSNRVDCCLLLRGDVRYQVNNSSKQSLNLWLPWLGGVRSRQNLPQNIWSFRGFSLAEFYIWVVCILHAHFVLFLLPYYRRWSQALGLGTRNSGCLCTSVLGKNRWDFLNWIHIWRVCHHSHGHHRLHFRCYAYLRTRRRSWAKLVVI